MTLVNSRLWSTVAEEREPYQYGVDLRGALQVLLTEADIEGIGSVHLLPSESRYANANDKVFFILATHDVKRDEKIVNIMLQFENVDYDLVPAASAAMVPSAAAKVF